MRAHVIIPDNLVKSIDKLVGRRERSKFLTEAAEKEICRIKLKKAAEKAGGSLKDVDILGWGSAKSAASWVRESRKKDQNKLEHDLKRI